jgi:hypothetical protein
MKALNEFANGLGLMSGPQSKASESALPAEKVQVAYKKAFLQDAGHLTHFRGVVGNGYNVDAEAAISPLDSFPHVLPKGFHAYASFADALKHPQEGNVLLEVLLSGEVEELELGFVASHQRVLQVMPYICSYCKAPPTHFAHVMNYDLIFACTKHLRLERFCLAAVKFVSNFAPARGEGYLLAPLEKLPEAFPWLDEHRVVVAEVAGPRKFVPTAVDGGGAHA